MLMLSNASVRSHTGGGGVAVGLGVGVDVGVGVTAVAELGASDRVEKPTTERKTAATFVRVQPLILVFI